MNLDDIRRRLAGHRPATIDDAGAARAAVAMVLRQIEGGTEILLIQRAIRESDPWSGHMALPGGRRNPGDRDLVCTAVRETREEVGIDIGTHGDLLGGLDDLLAVSHRLVISPVVCALRAPVTVTPDPTEVESAVWVPLDHLCSADAHAVHRWTHDGAAEDYPAYRYDRFTIWGLTHHILDDFFRILGT